jgi:hypothetical protein
MSPVRLYGLRRDQISKTLSCVLLSFATCLEGRGGFTKHNANHKIHINRTRSAFLAEIRAPAGQSLLTTGS